ncbi:MAG: GAF domain-containing protein [Desulfobacterales bacterium]|nr:GAF domain-containing protein [Desulfobacterales bacterium]
MRVLNKTLWAVTGVSLLFVAYIGILVAVNYRWSEETRREEAASLRREVQYSASAMGYFFAERRNELQAMAEGPEVSTYFKNKALGMSFEYGLGANLDMMAESFRRLIRHRHLQDGAIYSRLAMFDASGSVLVDTKDPAGGGEVPRGRWVGAKSKSSGVVFALEGPGGPEPVAAVPLYLKGKYMGKLAAWIEPSILDRFAGLSGTTSGYRRHIDFGIPASGKDHNPPLRDDRASNADQNPERISSSGPHLQGAGDGAEKEWLSTRENIAGTPFQIVARQSVCTLSKRWGSWKMPTAMGILAAAFLAGSVAVFFLHTRKVVLQVRLAEESRGRRKLASANCRLEDEIRCHNETEHSLRWEISLNEALAEMAGAILARQSMEELCDIVLDRALQITGSRTGYVGYIDPDSGALVCPTFTDGVSDRCRVRGKNRMFESFTGLWGWVLKNKKPLLANTPASDPRARGIPEGHVPIERFLSVPSMFEQKLVGQISVANSEEDYSDQDRLALERLSDLYAIAVKRLRDETMLQEVNTELEKRVRIRTAQLEKLNQKLTEEIASRKNAETGRQSMEQRMASMVQAAPVGIFINDRQGRLEYVNPAFLHMFGYERAEELLGNEAALLASPEDRPLLQQMKISSGGDGGKKYSHEGQGLRKSGEAFDAVLWCTAIDTGGGKALLGFVVDISQEKMLERQFRQAQKMEAVGRLAGGLAHDFNNLMTVVIGCANQIALETNQSDQVHQDALEIQRAGERAGALTRQLLSFSRKQVVKPEVVCINDVVLEMEKMIRRVIGEDVTVIASLDPELDNVRQDRGQIGQIIMNLAVNARDAMPRGGGLTIATANVSLPRGAFPADGVGIDPGDYVVLSMRDTGTGMDEETRLKIFEPFFTTKEQGKGSGLGLSTVYGIVKQNGGHIVCESEPGRGTDFKIYLPRTWETEQAEPISTPSGAHPGGAETLLLVEDDHVLRTLAARTLKSYGYEIIEAADGKAALALFKEGVEAIDLLVTDVVMPKMDGNDLARQVLDLKPGIKILFLSGYAGKVLLPGIGESGGLYFLEKPFTPETFAKTVREALDRKTTPDLLQRTSKIRGKEATS